MKTFVVTPVGPGTDPDHLVECLDSVRAQTSTATHVLVIDGPAPNFPASKTIDSILLPQNTNDIGSTPRTVGAAYAWGLGADAIAFLDADCSYLPDHLERLHSFQRRTEKHIVCSGRILTDITGTHRAPCPETSMKAKVPFHDTNTFLITRDAIGISYTYGTLTGRDQHLIGDRILTQRALPYLACHYHPTVLYRSVHRCHYQHFGWPIPEGVTLKDIAAEQTILAAS